jgi:predicted GIY-YIG superfamily endonuclease
MAERNTYKYHLKQGHKTVHKGITYDLERREAQHQEQYPSSTIKQVGRLVTRDAALKWERNGGKRPYHKAK